MPHDVRNFKCGGDGRMGGCCAVVYSLAPVKGFPEVPSKMAPQALPRLAAGHSPRSGEYPGLPCRSVDGHSPDVEVGGPHAPSPKIPYPYP